MKKFVFQSIKTINTLTILIICFFMTLLITQSGLAQCPSDNNETFTTDGDFIVPSGVTSITIEAIGADGGFGSGNNGGGTGATTTTTFTVSPNDVLRYVVGQNGIVTAQKGGGGGGTGVFNVTTNQLLIVAGGGGGELLQLDGEGGGNNIIDNDGTVDGAGGGNGADGGGGGGFNSDGSSVSGQGTYKGLQGNAAGAGAGGTSVFGNGGSGFGGGGASGNIGAGGGGGYNGGNSGGNGNSGGGGKGGDSFYNSAIGSLISNTPGTNGNGDQSPGSVTFCWSDSIATIPTMGEWALIIFALILLSTSTIYIMRWQFILKPKFSTK